MSDDKTVEGWKAIAKLWSVTERTARRWARRYPGLVRRNRLSGRVFGYRQKLLAFKIEHDEGEPVGCVEPGRRASAPSTHAIV